MLFNAIFKKYFKKLSLKKRGNHMEDICKTYSRGWAHKHNFYLLSKMIYQQIKTDSPMEILLKDLYYQITRYKTVLNLTVFREVKLKIQYNNDTRLAKKNLI